MGYNGGPDLVPAPKSLRWLVAAFILSGAALLVALVLGI